MAVALQDRQPSAGIVLPQIGLREKLLVFVFCNALTLDFKAKVSGGNLAQLVFVALTIASGALLIFQNKDLPSIKPVRWATGLFVAAVVVNFGDIFFANLMAVPEFDIQNALRMSAALIMPAIGIMVVHTLARRGYPMSTVMNPLVFSAIVSAIWRFFVGRKDTSDFSLTDTRWEILSPVLFLLIGVGMVGLLYNRKADWLSYVSVALFVFLAIASATRSLFLAALGGSIALPPLWLLSGRLKDVVFVLRLVVGAVGCLLAAALAITLLTSIRADAVDALANRNKSADYRDPQGNPHDLTLMLREAQIPGMKREMDKSPAYHVFGRGLGVPYYLDRYYEGSVPPEWFYTGPADFSDLGLVYLVYALGWPLGGGMVLFMALIPFVGVWVAARLSRIGAEDESIQVARSSIAIAAFFFLNLTWAGTYERGSMLFFGILSGVILVGLHRSRGAVTETLEDLRMRTVRRSAALAAR